jgi:ParB-like chromosome segregation protein Spo0J
LQNPIVLTEDYALVSGRHRLEAAKRLGHDTIEANVLPLSSEEAELAEIDENLIRKELTALEQGLLLKRRKEILDSMGLLANPSNKGHKGKYQVTPDNVTTVKTNKEIAADIGLNERTARRREQIAKNLDPEVVEMLHDTELANQPVKLLELSQKAPEIQKAIVEVIKTEKAKTVSEAEKVLFTPCPVEVPAPYQEASDATLTYEVIYADLTLTKDMKNPLVDYQIADNATLFLWALEPKLDVAMDLGRAWGFKYKGGFVWDKRYDTQGAYHQRNHAHLLIFVKGKHDPLKKRPDWGSIWTQEAQEFTFKPEAFKHVVFQLFGGLAILEI